MRAVVDTNVLVSAILRNRLPEKVILWLVARPEWEWIATRDILSEYTSVLRRKKFGLPEALIQRWCDLLDETITLVEAEEYPDFPRDQKDAKFLACAIAGEADVLISSDKDFNEAPDEVKDRVLSPSGFVRVFMSG
jgi:uncharacterized protein